MLRRDDREMHSHSWRVAEVRLQVRCYGIARVNASVAATTPLEVGVWFTTWPTLRSWLPEFGSPI